MLYFLHIPKTSGSALMASISNNPEIVKNCIFPDNTLLPENKEQILKFFKSKKFDNYSFIKGHFACTPYIYSDNIQSFSLIRDPLERSISYFKYHVPASAIVYPESFYFYLNQNPNIQSANLTGCLKWEKINRKEYRCYLDTPEISFNELLINIKQKNITLSTVKNRKFLLKEIEQSFSLILNKKIFLDPDCVTNGYRIQYNPYTMDLSCLTQNVKEDFKLLNNLDYQLYNYVKDHETETGRSLTPSDIVF